MNRKKDCERLQKHCKTVIALGLAAVMSVAGVGCTQSGGDTAQTDGKTEPLELYEYELGGMSEETLLNLFAAFSRPEIRWQLEINLIYEAETYDIFDVSGGKLIRVDYDENGIPIAVRFTDEPEGETEPDDVPLAPDNRVF